MDLDCQEYVPDIPNELEDEFILEEGDEEKCAARKGLKATQAAIPNLVFMAIKYQHVQRHIRFLAAGDWSIVTSVKIGTRKEMEQKILEIFDGQNGFSAMADMSPSIFALYILHHKRLQAVFPRGEVKRRLSQTMQPASEAEGH
ncbi:hypothetical protein I7I51_08198 [Histoplasma capsulatum]|uniref:Uncharacterized protein n=1 Tax=Ajellomyces capsulatus TaxID=5037 RepID=A0A8A1LY01_AJECA|nr:hypothetical protein I7I51_08198 [Histoplasma capsulatum]